MRALKQFLRVTTRGKEGTSILVGSPDVDKHWKVRHSLLVAKCVC